VVFDTTAEATPPDFQEADRESRTSSTP
jgi:hypothetical protein